MRDHSLATTARRSAQQVRLRWTAALALCLSCAAAGAAANDSQPVDSPIAGATEPGQFMAAPIELSLAEPIRTLLARSDSLPAAASFAELTQLREFYGARNYEPVWVHGASPPMQIDAVLAEMRAFDMQSPADLAPILSAIEARRQPLLPAQMAALDCLLNLALLRGAIDPADPLVAGPHPQALTAVATAKDPLAVLAQWLPGDPGFWQLRQAVDSYQHLAAAGGWPIGITGKDKEDFAFGVRSEQIALLRERLAVTGDYRAPVVATATLPPINPTGISPAKDAPDPMIMDQALIEGVKHFQTRHGLFADGVVGKMTLDALNEPVESRLLTMMINLRRLQLANRAYSSDYVMVNIAGQQMKLVRNGMTRMTSDVIVGTVNNRTPEVESAINRIEFNPVWYVPTSIQSKELLPKIQEDATYIASQNFRVFDTATGQHIDPATVNWHSDDAKSGRYKLRQAPGGGNALGAVKFLFPNPYDVYMHDTNKPALFAKQVRTLSHGCVRVPDALGLAEVILATDPAWSRERIDAILQKGTNRSVTLQKPLPVHLVYQTSWVGERGQIEFRNDIYGRDKRIAEEMKIALATP
ncbi:MAG: murein L,D-transpeptidase [Dongiaceae bacterium]